ncbi:fasciclin domain-containing protein [Ruegeria marina]|uniref:Uncaracterized surface protein containing fasciclin (FAS1) repeats n=1 Tax=Ruegeria marina TaxID=639004 RepID=A0A1G7FGV2_9RHOB|nr:fasciclin domain-containing protein [Ruegeria marina]SDE75149.1 Uncaracterized surface protein containing fasciclin (FAS1) repeats [Ruegeria marina]
MATFVEIATSDPDSRFDMLVNAATFVDAQIPGSNIVATLSDPAQNLTLFAPTDAAFGLLATDLGFTGDATDETGVTNFLVGLGAETLRNVLLYHVAGTPLTAAQIGTSGSVTPLAGPAITADLPTLVDAEPDVIDPSVAAADIAADNGILHIIDRVLLPTNLPGNDAPTLAGLVAASGSGFDSNNADFDLLLQAVTTASLAGALDDPNADLTVFAPTDAAFVGTAQALGFSGTDEAGAFTFLVEALTLLGGGDPIPILTQILTYHVAGESLQASQVLAAGSIETLQGGTLTLNGASIVDADPDLPDPSLIQTDIQASNGVAHVIDGVLLPVDILASDGSNDVDFTIDGDMATAAFLGADNDFFDGNGGADTIGGGAGNDVLFGGADDDQVFGADGDDIVNGNEGADIVGGGAGHDTVRGEAGDDNAFGGLGDDLVVGGAGNDVVTGAAGNDVLVGNEGNDTIYAGAGNDQIFAGAGDDVVFFGRGDVDSAYGGTGADVFQFHAQDGFARIEDFENGIDRIDVSAFGFSGFADIQDNVFGNSDRAFVDLGGASFTLVGFDVANLGQEDFIF